MTTQNFDALYNQGYRPKNFVFLTPNGKGDPAGVGLFEKAGEFFESVIYERFDTWLYATPEKLGGTMKTLAEALALLPEYWPLTPGVDKWKAGDRCVMHSTISPRWVYFNAPDSRIGTIVDVELGQREIPQSVREAEAYVYLMDCKLAPGEVTPVINAVSVEALKLARKNSHPLLSWVEENRK